MTGDGKIEVSESETVDNDGFMLLKVLVVMLEVLEVYCIALVITKIRRNEYTR